jgi:hypothetical protein
MKFWTIVNIITFIVIIILAICYKESVNAWAETPIGEQPTRHLVAICYFTAWLGSVIGRKRD